MTVASTKYISRIRSSTAIVGHERVMPPATASMAYCTATTATNAAIAANGSATRAYGPTASHATVRSAHSEAIAPSVQVPIRNSFPRKP